MRIAIDVSHAAFCLGKRIDANQSAGAIIEKSCALLDEDVAIVL
jgi:hypothetical protein